VAKKPPRYDPVNTPVLDHFADGILGQVEIIRNAQAAFTYLRHVISPHQHSASAISQAMDLIYIALQAEAHRRTAQFLEAAAFCSSRRLRNTGALLAAKDILLAFSHDWDREHTKSLGWSRDDVRRHVLLELSRPEKKVRHEPDDELESDFKREHAVENMLDEIRKKVELQWVDEVADSMERRKTKLEKGG
jgi:hypothetical protein